MGVKEARFFLFKFITHMNEMEQPSGHIRLTLHSLPNIKRGTSGIFL